MADWLDEIEAQADETSPFYLPRLISEIRRLRALVERGSAPPEGTPDIRPAVELLRLGERASRWFADGTRTDEAIDVETALKCIEGALGALEGTRASEAALTDDVLHAATEAIFGYSWRRPGLQYEKGRAILVAALKETR